MIDRTTGPALRHSTFFELPKPDVIQFGTNREIYYLPSKQPNAVKIEVVFPAGKYYDIIPGTAQFTAQMLTKGIPGKNAAEIAGIFEFYGAHLEAATGNDFSSISLYALGTNLAKILPLFFLVISEPTLPESEFELYRKIFEENLKVNLEKNSFIADNQIKRQIFGSHPYGTSVQLNDLPNINSEILRKFFLERYSPIKIFISGWLGEDDLKTVVDHSAKTKDSIKEERIEMRPVEKSTNTIDGPNNIQASLKFGKRIISRDHPEAPELFLINHIIGGYFGSRLMKNIREEKGLTYGIHSFVQNFRDGSTLMISADVNSANIELAIKEISHELTMEISYAEIEIAKQHFIGSLQTDITTVFAAQDKIKNLALFNLELNYYQELITTISKLDIGINETFIKYFNPGDFSMVAVK